MPPYDRHAIAARLRKLLRPGFIDLPAIAARLGVDESALRDSMDERSPRPSVDVLTAAVRQLGVDPTWLLTGDYSRGTHVAALDEADLSEAGVRRLLMEFAAAVAVWPPATPSNGVSCDGS